jgi:hypothetical protein
VQYADPGRVDRDREHLAQGCDTAVEGGAAKESGAEVNGWRSVVYFNNPCLGSLTCSQ